MSALVVYRSQHGCAEKCAVELAGKLKDEVTLVDLKREAGVDIGGFDIVLVGGSIHAGRVQKAVIKKVAKIEGSVSRINEGAIDAFAEKLNRV